jgi:hypothetical protein
MLGEFIAMNVDMRTRTTTMKKNTTTLYPAARLLLFRVSSCIKGECCDL